MYKVTVMLGSSDLAEDSLVRQEFNEFVAEESYLNEGVKIEWLEGVGIVLTSKKPAPIDYYDDSITIFPNQSQLAWSLDTVGVVIVPIR